MRSHRWRPVRNSAAVAARVALGAALMAGAGHALGAQPVARGDLPSTLGISVSASGGSRDTLGLLVVAVTPDSPADRAGITEGSRIASVNGVALGLTADEVGQAAAADAAVRRFSRELGAGRPGAPVVLQLFGGGRRQTLTVTTGGGAPPTAPTAPIVAPQAVTPPAAVPPAVGPASVAPPAVGAPAVGAPAVAPSTGAALPGAPLPVVPAAPVAAASSADSARAATLGGVIERMGALQQTLHQLARDERSLAFADTLADAEEDLATLRRRLRLAEARAARADSAVGELPGLRLAPVSDDLAPYFGEGSARGLLVVDANATWDPIRSGDVVLRIDGAPATAERLRTAFDPRHRGTIELLRRRRVLTVTLHGRTGA